MSSLVGHAATGAAIYFSRSHAAGPHPRWVLPLFVLLAVVPDVDYLGLWWFHIVPQPRVTHSLLFCLGIAVPAWWFARRVTAGSSGLMSCSAFALATCSHLVLDLLVGVHSLPVFWPLAHAEVTSPIGLLPSAGHLRLGNYYLWRNLFIECAVLWPVLLAVVAWRRAIPLRSVWPKAAFLLPLWVGGMVWSLQLQR
jgi:hypothetical protein